LLWVGGVKLLDWACLPGPDGAGGAGLGLRSTWPLRLQVASPGFFTRWSQGFQQQGKASPSVHVLLKPLLLHKANTPWPKASHMAKHRIKEWGKSLHPADRRNCKMCVFIGFNKQFRFTEKLRRYRDFSYTLCPQTCTASPIISILH